jgi:hypothetical protein
MAEIKKELSGSFHSDNCAGVCHGKNAHFPFNSGVNPESMVIVNQQTGINMLI